MYYHQSGRLYSYLIYINMPNILLGAPDISGKGSGESEAESELDTPRTELNSDSESSETSTRHTLFKPVDAINKASVHLRRAMVHTRPHIIQKQHSFFCLDVSVIDVLFEYLCRSWPIVEVFGHLCSGCVRSFGTSSTLLHVWWSVASALSLLAH